MPPYQLYEVMDDMWIVATNEEGAQFIRALQVSK